MNENQTKSLILYRLEDVVDDEVQSWLDLGLISTIEGDGTSQFISKAQFDRLKKYTVTINEHHMQIHSSSLFPAEKAVMLAGGTMASSHAISKNLYENNSSIIAQLLPHWAEESVKKVNVNEKIQESYISVDQLDITTKSEFLIERVKIAQHRIATLSGSRATQFSRSAHYMGSKATLAPFFNEILNSFVPKNCIVLDLMCGSGASAGVFAKSWPTYASDAQAFSRLLAVVQGGGMTEDQAKKIAEHVLELARVHFQNMPADLQQAIQTEQNFLATELTSDVFMALRDWVMKYPRIGNPLSDEEFLTQLVLERRLDPSARPYLLFSTFYGNLFFGVRQAAEIDSLRFAIDQLEDANERAWALGALVCAASSCAFTYGGHFAQPKLDAVDLGKFKKNANEMLVQRGLSVTHEFFVRLTSLGGESSRTSQTVVPIDGPWENAINETARRVGKTPVCVYFDPPYTRDEYSRYYHTLETLVRYDYPVVKGKPSIPRPRDGGRFSSEFCTRFTSQVEDAIVQVIEKCFDLGWSCLWSYSNTGVVMTNRVLERLHDRIGQIEIFVMDHAYKAQGKQKAKAVKEYAVFMSPI